MTILNARPNRNGSTLTSMVDDLMSLRDAVAKADAALRVVMNDPCHGRNYQTVPNSISARSADLALLGSYRDSLMALDRLALDTAVQMRQEAGIL